MADGALDLFAMASALIIDGEREEDEGVEDLQADKGACFVSTAERKRIRAQNVRADTKKAWLEDQELELLERIDYDRVSPADFREKFELKDLPVLIDGVTSDWPLDFWSFKCLEEKFGQVDFALFNGQQFALREYLSYARGERAEADEAPLYLFEDLSLMEPDSPKLELLSAYQIPKYFRDDLFELDFASDVQAEHVEAVRKSRPRFRWLLIGPANSGSKVHCDPLGTSAWNTLLQGNKRWVLFPPCLGPSEVDEICYGANQKSKRQSITVGNWFAARLPKFRAEPERFKLVEFTQRAGETVFIPAGWWHAVFNLESTLAVTQNFASAHRYAQVAQEIGLQPASEFKLAWQKVMAAGRVAL